MRTVSKIHSTRIQRIKRSNDIYDSEGDEEAMNEEKLDSSQTSDSNSNEGMEFTIYDEEDLDEESMIEGREEIDPKNVKIGKHYEMRQKNNNDILNCYVISRAGKVTSRSTIYVIL